MLKKMLFFIIALIMLFNFPMVVLAEDVEFCDNFDDVYSAENTGGYKNGEYLSSNAAHYGSGEKQWTTSTGTSSSTGIIRTSYAPDSNNMCLEFQSDAFEGTSIKYPRVTKVLNVSASKKIALDFDYYASNSIFYIDFRDNEITNNYALIYLDNGKTQGRTKNDLSNDLEIGKWYSFTVIIDIEAWRYSIYYDNRALVNNAALAPNNNGGSFEKIQVNFKANFPAKAVAQNFYIDNIKIRSCTDSEYSFSVADVVNAELNLMDINFGMTPNSSTMTADSICVTDQNGQQASIDSITKISYDSYRVEFSEPLNPNTFYNLSLNGVNDIIGRFSTGSASFTTGGAKFSLYNFSINKNGNELINLQDGLTNFSAKVSNGTTETKSGLVMAAVYNSDGKLNGFYSASDLLDYKEKRSYDFPIEINTENDHVLKTFAWDSFSGMLPFYSSVKITKNDYIEPDKLEPLSNDSGIYPNIVDIVNKKITISTKFSTKDDKISVLVVPESTELDTLDANSPQISNSIIYINEGVSDQNGFAVFSFNYEKTGGYDVYVKDSSTGEAFFESFFFPTDKMVTDGVEDFNKAGSVAAFKEAFENNFKVFNIKSSLYNNLDEASKEKIYSVMYNLRNEKPNRSFSDPNDIGETFFRAIILIAVDAEGDIAKILKLLTDNETLLDIETLNTFITELNDTAKNAVLTQISNFSMVDGIDLIALFNTSVITKGILHSQNWSDTYKILLDYKDLIGIDFTGYNNLKTPSEASKKLVNRSFGTLLSLKNEFNSVVKTLKAQEGAPASGGGGISSSKSYGISSGMLSAPKEPIVIEESESVIEDWGDEPQGFNDISDFEWAAESINYLHKNNIINGISEGVFAPQNKVKREEIIKMIIVTFGYENPDAVCTFNDVSENDWFYKYVASAQEMGISNGTNDGSFGSGNFITRQDITTLIYRTAKIAGIEFENGGNFDFADEFLINDYAVEAVSALNKAGIINGISDNEFAPFELCTRAQAAKILFGIINYKNMQ